MEEPGISCNKCWGELGKQPGTMGHFEVTPKWWNKAKPPLLGAEKDADSDS